MVEPDHLLVLGDHAGLQNGGVSGVHLDPVGEDAAFPEFGEEMFAHAVPPDDADARDLGAQSGEVHDDVAGAPGEVGLVLHQHDGHWGFGRNSGDFSADEAVHHEVPDHKDSGFRKLLDQAVIRGEVHKFFIIPKCAIRGRVRSIFLSCQNAHTVVTSKFAVKRCCNYNNDCCRINYIMSVLNQLFGSKTRVDVLTLLLLHPGQKFYLREIERRIGQDVNPIKRELDRLERMGIVLSAADGNRRYISINEKCNIYPEIKSLVLKTAAFGDTLRDRLAGAGNIEYAFIYGSFAKGEEHGKSDIDLFIVGNVDGRRLQAALSQAKGALGREINCSNFLMDEVRRRMKKNEPFIKDVMRGKKIFLVGEEVGLQRSLRRR